MAGNGTNQHNKPSFLRSLNLTTTQWSVLLYNIRERNNLSRGLHSAKIGRRKFQEVLSCPEAVREIEEARKYWRVFALSDVERTLHELATKKKDVNAIKFLLSSLDPAYSARRAGSGPGVGGTLGAQFVCDQGQSAGGKPKEDT